MLKIFILPVINHYEYFIVMCVSVRGVSVAVNVIFVHMDTHLSSRWICSSGQDFIFIHRIYISKDTGVENAVYVRHTVS
jgi:hypothetical protein